MKKLVFNNSVLFSITWALIIFVLCATPGQFIPSANWLDLLSFDKFVHASMFFILSTLFFIAAIKHKQSNTVLLSLFLLAVSYGGLLEIMQANYFSHRSGDWLDFIANSFGCIVAAAFIKKMKQYFAHAV